MADGALCLPSCPQRLPLLFPKNLAALRFSGTLIDAPCWRRFLPSAARRVKAPWQAARFACRLARCACRSSFPKISLRCDFREPCLFSGHTYYKTRGAFTSIQTKSKQKGPALKGAFCAPCGSSSLQYHSGYCCFVYRPNPSQNALFQGAKQSQAGKLPQMQGKARW